MNLTDRFDVDATNSALTCRLQETQWKYGTQTKNLFYRIQRDLIIVLRIFRIIK